VRFINNAHLELSQAEHLNDLKAYLEGNDVDEDTILELVQRRLKNGDFGRIERKPLEDLMPPVVL